MKIWNEGINLHTVLKPAEITMVYLSSAQQLLPTAAHLQAQASIFACSSDSALNAACYWPPQLCASWAVTILVSTVRESLRSSNHLFQVLCHSVRWTG